MLRGKGDFREPLLTEENGLYMTIAQMQFFLNRPNGQKLFEEGDPEFFIYLNECQIWNVIYDEVEKDSTACTIYWDPQSECVNYVFPIEGKIGQKLEKCGVLYDMDEDDDDEDEDTFGLFSK